MEKNVRTVLANISYLSILNALNLALPLLLIPYLTTTLGASYFGDYSYVLVIVQNMMMLTAYGFNYSATREISTHREDGEYVSRVFNATIAARLLIAVTLMTVLLVPSYIYYGESGRFFLFVTAMGMVVGDIMIPVWLFQGMERMKYVTIATATARVVFTGLVFVLITKAEEYKYVLALDSVGYLIAGGVSMGLAYKQFGVRIGVPAWVDVVRQLKDGFTIFCSTFFISLYRNVNVLILDFFVPSAAVGVYAAAEKVIKAAQSVVTPISQALFPHFSKRFAEHSLEENRALLWKIAKPLTLLTVVMGLGLVVCGGYLHLVLGEEFVAATGLLYIMTPVLTLGALNYLFGFVGLVNLGRQRAFFHYVTVSGVTSMALLAALAPVIGITAAAVSMTASEGVLLGMCVWRLWRG